jgi:hypothetical protein
MKRSGQSELWRELQVAGADEAEINKLLPIAIGLRKLSTPRQKTPRWKTPLLATGMTVAGLALGMALVIFSQAAMPGDWLYPVQKISDNAAVTLRPSYRGTVMMKRADQVKQLVAENARSGAVFTALADYQSEAAAYKSDAANYALFDYCKADLQQAANKATGPERTAITQTLASLQDV